MNNQETPALYPEFSHCTLCPRSCGVNRNSGETGFCNADAGVHIASICIHHGEEPVISGKNGICNVFFSHCNLQCLYCQNYQISNNQQTGNDELNNIEGAVQKIISCLDQGCCAVGFVSPTHFLPHAKAIIRKLHARGYHPIFVYNSNGYDSVSELKQLEGLIDIYLPDFKYFSEDNAREWSEAEDYPAMAKKAILEMYRQKGATLRMRDELHAESGLIVRHLVLPGCADESISILEWLAEHCSPRIHLSLMSQYAPTTYVRNHRSLGRSLQKEEYQRVVQAADRLGFTYGWTQEFSSQDHYLPDFNKDQPFSG